MGNLFREIFPDDVILALVVRSQHRRRPGGALFLWAGAGFESGAELARYVGDFGFTALAVMPGGGRVLTGNAIGQVVPFRLPT